MRSMLMTSPSSAGLFLKSWRQIIPEMYFFAHFSEAPQENISTLVTAGQG